jgi:hypothetical protein
MKKLINLFVFFCVVCIFSLMSCDGGSELGGCSVSCGGLGTGQPFRQTNYMFINEADCRKKGEESSGGCKASYCPPTGNSDDCYQVYP